MITSILRRMQPNRPHLAILVLLLLGSVVLTAFLAYQGYDVDKNQRRQAEQMLSDWAQLAAVEWNERVQRLLHSSIYYALDPGVPRDPSAPPDPEYLADNIALELLCQCFSRGDIRTFFTLDITTGQFQTIGVPLAPPVQAWVKAGIVQRGANPILAGAATSIGTFVGAPDGTQRVVMFLDRMQPGISPRVAYGVEMGAPTLGEYLDTVWRMGRLLPSSVMSQMPNDWILSATVTDAQDRVWYQSAGRYPQQFHYREPMGGVLRDVEVTVAVRPDAAEQLLIGGLPSSRLHTLLSLLALTSGLLVVALVLIRREVEIARLRSDFIAGVSHELRTPLAQIRMFAETLMLGRVRTEVERHRSLEIIDQEARRLTHLVENVLLFARAERRSGRINAERIDLAADVRDAVHGFAILSRSRAVELRAELQEGVIAHVDRSALRQILLNLLDNAVKYGPLAQRITVGMALFNGSARIWVDDEGSGIPESDRIRVFDSFYRLERDIASPVAGSGIGLSIVRELVTLHDGRVWIEDAPGTGTRVVLELPNANLRPEVAKDGWAVA